MKDVVRAFATIGKLPKGILCKVGVVGAGIAHRQVVQFIVVTITSTIRGFGQGVTGRLTGRIHALVRATTVLICAVRTVLERIRMGARAEIIAGDARACWIIRRPRSAWVAGHPRDGILSPASRVLPPHAAPSRCTSGPQPLRAMRFGAPCPSRVSPEFLFFGAVIYSLRRMARV